MLEEKKNYTFIVLFHFPISIMEKWDMQVQVTDVQLYM